MTAGVHDDDLVGVARTALMRWRFRQSMESAATRATALAHARGGQVDLAKPLVGDDNGCVSQERTRQGQAATLAARRRSPMLPTTVSRPSFSVAQPVGEVHGL